MAANLLQRREYVFAWSLCALVGSRATGTFSKRNQSFADDSERMETKDSKGDDKDKRSSRCQKYNSFLETLLWTERRKRCNLESGCTFVGRSVTGSCMALEHVTSESHTKDEIDISKRVWDAADIDSFRSSQSIAADLAKQIVVETAVDSAVESLKDSQQLANEIAKELILQLLKTKENQGKLGQFLEYIFAYETVLSPTRELVYWSLAGRDCTTNLTILSKRQRDYWLAKPPRALTFDYHLLTNTRDYQVSQSMIGAGRPYTEANLLWLADWWLRDKESRETTVKPLLDWSLKLEEEVIKPVALMSAKSIPYNKVSSVITMIVVIVLWSLVVLLYWHHSLRSSSPCKR
jgi:hypothetical protein